MKTTSELRKLAKVYGGSLKFGDSQKWFENTSENPCNPVAVIVCPDGPTYQDEGSIIQYRKVFRHWKRA